MVFAPAGRNVYNPRCKPGESTAPHPFSPNGALQNRRCYAPLGLLFYGGLYPPVYTGGYRHFAPLGQFAHLILLAKFLSLIPAA